MAASDALHPGQMSLFHGPDYEVEQPESGPPETEEHARFAASAPMHIRVGPSAITGIAAQGFKTQHETGFSSGTYDPDYRTDFEEHVWGKGARPVYGYFSHGDVRDEGWGSTEESVDPEGEDVTTYGSTALRLKENVREHTTYTAGDSLGAPAEAVAKPGQQAQKHAYGYAYGGGYTEMQVHKKPLTMQDVQEAVHFRPAPQSWWGEGEASHRLAQESYVRQDLMRAGIPHEVRSIKEQVQSPLPLSEKDWRGGALGPEMFGVAYTKLPEAQTSSVSEPVARWSPEHGEYSMSKGGILRPERKPE